LSRFEQQTVSVERNSVGKEQLLEPLPRLKRGPHPEIVRAAERPANARIPSVEFFELA
jgi:hypothetical protein